MQISMFDGSEPLKIKKPIRLIELFAGIGAQAAALRNIGANFEHYRICEFDKYAVRSYNVIHGTNFEPSDITKITEVDLGITETDKYTYIMTYSFPCFVGNTLVLTGEGLKKICDIKVGDIVLSHTNRYHEVIATQMTGKHKIYSLKSMGSDEIRCTGNHKFYVREMKRVYPTYENGKRGSVRTFLSPQWVECKNLTKKHYLGIAINHNEIVPKWEGVVFPWADGRKSRKSNILSSLMEEYNFWWIIGRYLGDGWKRTQGGIIICCDKKETSEITEKLDYCGLSYCIVADRTVNKIHIPIKEISEFVTSFGYGASGKKLPAFVFNMPRKLLEGLIDGYVSADGCITNGCYKLNSISKDLIYGMAQIVAKTYHTPYRIYHTKRKDKCIIEGRTCNQKSSWELVYKKDACKQDKAFYEDGYIWIPIRSIEDTGECEEVYDIEVAGSHSFTANGIIAHNCTDLSLAGKQAGMEKGSGTRSGLLWEVERLLRELSNRGGQESLPQVLLMENVPQVHGTANKDSFDDWCNFLLDLGYKNKWCDLNAKDFGVPQNRERTFMVSWLGDYYYDFPTGWKLTKKLRDVLEDKVDEKYYLSDDTIKRINGWKAQQDPLKHAYEERILSPCLTARGAGEEHSGMVLVTDKEV